MPKSRDSTCLRISNVTVWEPWLMRTAEQFASAHGKQTMWLGVWEHNEPAKAFYRAMGFVETGAHTFVLGSDAQTDLIMKHALTAC